MVKSIKSTLPSPFKSAPADSLMGPLRRLEARHDRGAESGEAALLLGQLAISNFPNPQGLAPLGHSNWAETFSSGNVIRGTAGSANIGLVQSGALETSNVDLTKELVDMITSQRAFQANAQMITTDDQITQTILQIR